MIAVHLGSGHPSEGKVVFYACVSSRSSHGFVMISKELQMARRRTPLYFAASSTASQNVIGISTRRLRWTAWPLFMVYNVGSMELAAR